MKSPGSPTALSRCSEESVESEPASTAKGFRASSIANVSTRRGGYMDSGGYTASGEVPEAAPINVNGERQLRSEVDGLIRQLNVDEEWTRRIEALLRLEGLVKGGAAAIPGFLDQLKTLQDPIIVQLQDRRSAVSRQACHLISVLSEHMGPRLEPLALAFLPALFKVVVITVQIMAESADACVRSLLQHCHCARLLPRLCSTLCKDRSAKLRQCAAEYLILVLEQWDSTLLDKSAGALEEAVLAAAQDAVGETRTAGRAAFAAYCRARPERLHPLLARQDPGLQQKLREALVAYVPGSAGNWAGLGAAGLGATGPAAKQPARRHSALPAPPPGASRCASMKPSASGARFSIAGLPSAALAAMAAAETSAAQLPRRPPANSRKSVGGAALRVMLPGGTQDNEPSARLASAASRDYAASRVAALPGYDHVQASECSGSARTNAGLDRVPQFLSGGSSPTSPPLSQLLQAFTAAGTDWKAKSDAFAALESAMQRPDIAIGVAAHLDRFVTIFLENMSDAHVRVAAACVCCLGAALGSCGGLLERHLGRLVPPLLVRAADSKEAIRRAATDALAVLPGVISADTFLSTLTAAVGGAKSTKAQTAAIETFTAVAPLLRDPGAAALRAWAACMASAAQDKHKEVRRAAELALSAIHRHLDSAVIAEVVSSEPGDVQIALLRNLQAMSLSKRQAPQPGAQPTSHRLVEPSSVPHPTPPDATSASSSSGSPPQPATPLFGASSPLASPLQAELTVPAASARGEANPPAEPAPAPAQAAAVRQTPTAAPAHAAAAARQTAARENAGSAPSPKAAPSPRHASAVLAATSPLGDVSNLPVLASPTAQQQPAASPQLSTPAGQQQRAFPAGLVASPMLTPPTAFRQPRPHFATRGDAETFLQKLMADLASSEAASTFQALQRVTAAVPQPLWKPHMPTVVQAVRETAATGDVEARKQALAAVQAFASEAGPVLGPHFADLAPLLLDCACDPSREVQLLAQQAMDACLANLPVRGCCLEPLLQHCASDLESSDSEPAGMQALFRAVSQAVKRMGAGEAEAVVGTPLLPCLVKAFGHSSADVRKAVVFCLVELRLTVQDAKLAPELASLSTSQQKLLAIYVDRAKQQQQTLTR